MYYKCTIDTCYMYYIVINVMNPDVMWTFSYSTSEILWFCLASGGGIGNHRVQRSVPEPLGRWGDMLKTPPWRLRNCLDHFQILERPMTEVKPFSFPNSWRSMFQSCSGGIKNRCLGTTEIYNSRCRAKSTSGFFVLSSVRACSTCQTMSNAHCFGPKKHPILINSPFTLKILKLS